MDTSPLAPTLVLVSGMPATGKSTLAAQLGTELGWPVFTKDAIKELLFDAAGHDPDAFDDADSDVIGTQAMALLHHLADVLTGAGCHVVLEANFRADLAAQDYEPFLGRAQVRHVYCDLDADEVLDRYVHRLERNERHPVHVDTGEPALLAADLAAKDYGPIPLPIPTLTVRTDAGFDPPLAEIVAFCRS